MAKFTLRNRAAAREPKPFNWTNRQYNLLQHWKQLIDEPSPVEWRNLDKNDAISLRAQMNKVRSRNLQYQHHLKLIQDKDIELVIVENREFKNWEILLQPDHEYHDKFKLIFQHIPIREFTFVDGKTGLPRPKKDTYQIINAKAELLRIANQPKVFESNRVDSLSADGIQPGKKIFGGG